MLLGKSKVEDQRAVGRAMRETPGYKACHNQLWFEHNSGLGLGFADAGSRDKLSVLNNLAAAFGRRRVRIDALATLGVVEMLSAILDSTTDYVKPKRSGIRRVAFAHSRADLRRRLNEETGNGVCPSAEHHNSASQVESLSPTPPRPARAPLPAPPPTQGPTPLQPSPVRPLPPICTNGPSPTPARRLSPTPPRASTTQWLGPRVHARSSPVASTRVGEGFASVSPQPLTAAAARAAAAVESAAQLTGSASATTSAATRQELRALCTAAHFCEVQGIPRGTKSHDEWGFKWVRKFAERFGLRWMTPRHALPHEARTLERFVALALFHIVPEMQPAPRTLAKGIDQAKPPSGMNAIYGWRRVMRDSGRFEPDMRAAGRMLRGMIEQLKSRCGQDVMSVDHHIPYPLQSIVRAANYLSSYANTAWPAVVHDSLLVALKFNLGRGPRLDEWCEMFLGDTFYRRANFNWCHSGVVIGSTALLDLAPADPVEPLLRATNVPSKTDRGGAKWIGKHMWYKKSANPLNFPNTWAWYERKYPCPEAERRSWAAFSPEGNSKAFKPTAARAYLRDIWVSLEGEAFASMHSWHDFRATIATALSAADKPPAFTQAAVCWASPASVALYGQLTPDAMAEAAEIAATVDASRHAHVDVPHVCESSVVRELEACVSTMAAEPKQTRESTSSVKTSSSKATRIKMKPQTKARTAVAPAPPAAVPPALTFDVGPPLGSVVVGAPHHLDGTRISVKNNVWDAGTGSTWCTVRGFASTLQLNGHSGVFVVTADDDGQHYALTEQTMLSRNTSTQKRPRASTPTSPAAKRRAPKLTTPKAPRPVVCLSVRRSPRLSGAN